MKNFCSGLSLAGTLLLALAPTAAAQTTPSPAAYTGPRFPGGPDSLRAFVYRSTRPATPAPTGRMLVQFELKPDGQPHNFSLVRPPDPLNQPSPGSMPPPLPSTTSKLICPPGSPPRPLPMPKTRTPNSVWASTSARRRRPALRIRRPVSDFCHDGRGTAYPAQPIC